MSPSGPGRARCPGPAVSGATQAAWPRSSPSCARPSPPAAGPSPQARRRGDMVLGAHEQLPACLGGFAPWDARRGLYRRPASRTGELIRLLLRGLPRLRPRDHFGCLLDAGPVRKRAQPPQSLLNTQAELASVIRIAQASGATRPVDIKADVSRTDSRQLAPESLSPLCRVVSGLPRYPIRHAPMIEPQRRRAHREILRAGSAAYYGVRGTRSR